MNITTRSSPENDTSNMSFTSWKMRPSLLSRQYPWMSLFWVV